MSSRLTTRSVFINCPFDDEYKPLFDAVVFTVFDCGFVARSALEIDDSSEVRIEKIQRIIGSCRFGVHDISRTETDPVSGLPRFNMPLELGIFLGCKKFGRAGHAGKVCLILDREPHRYQQFLSDIAGQDIKSHGRKPLRAISIIRDWLRSHTGHRPIPGGTSIHRKFQRFQGDLPRICELLQTTVRELTFNDYADIVSRWLIEQNV